MLGLICGVIRINWLSPQYNLPLELINRQNLTEWMEILKTVVDRDVPLVSRPGEFLLHLQ